MGKEEMDEHGLCDWGTNPIKFLEEETLNFCGLSRERAFAIDDSNIGKLVDEYAFQRLAERFYGKVYSDEDEWFRKLFRDESLQLNIMNLGDYLAQRTGGSTYYSVRQGFPSLGERHCTLNIDERMAERWLNYMEETLEESKHDFKEEHQHKLMDFMRFSAYYMIVYRRYRQRFIEKSSHF